MTLNPLSARVWRSAWYLLCYQLLCGLLFTASFTAAVVAASLSITLAGIPLLIAASSVIRGCATLERARLRLIFPGRLHVSYLKPTRPGLFAAAATRWKDPATWHELGYLVGMFVPLAILNTVVLYIWIVLLAGVTLPIWYWAPVNHYPHGLTVHGVQLGNFPNGPSGHGAVGIYIDTLPKALLAAVISLILFALFSNVLVATARAHAVAARALLRAPEDPLAQAKEVLNRPGPLTSLSTHNDV
jgi:hypothetical protein